MAPPIAGTLQAAHFGGLMPVAHRGGPWEAVRTLDGLATRVRREIDGRVANGASKALHFALEKHRSKRPRIAQPHIFHVAFRTFAGI